MKNIMNIFKKKKRHYSIDERLNKQISRDINRRKTGVIIFLSSLFCLIVVLLCYVLGRVMYIF